MYLNGLKVIPKLIGIASDVVTDQLCLNCRFRVDKQCVRKRLCACTNGRLSITR